MADFGWIDLTNDSNFLIIACDGLWDVMSNEAAVAWVKDYFAKNEELLLRNVTETLSKAGQAMAAHAIKIGSDDNVSVTIVLFHAPSSNKTNTDDK